MYKNANLSNLNATILIESRLNQSSDLKGTADGKNKPKQEKQARSHHAFSPVEFLECNHKNLRKKRFINYLSMYI